MTTANPVSLKLRALLEKLTLDLAAAERRVARGARRARRAFNSALTVTRDKTPSLKWQPSWPPSRLSFVER